MTKAKNQREMRNNEEKIGVISVSS